MSALKKLQQAIASDDYLILDTEATDKYPDVAQIIQLAVIDSQGNTLMDTFVNPGVRITNTFIHGISDVDVAHAPTFAEIAEDFFDIVRGRILIVYNADYDIPLIRAEVKRFGGHIVDSFEAVCAMKAYAEYNGEKHAYYGTFTYKKLTDAVKRVPYALPEGIVSHSALGDCLMTLAVCRFLKEQK